MRSAQSLLTQTNSKIRIPSQYGAYIETINSKNEAQPIRSLQQNALFKSNTNSRLCGSFKEPLKTAKPSQTILNLQLQDSKAIKKSFETTLTKTLSSKKTKAQLNGRKSVKSGQLSSFVQFSVTNESLKQSQEQLVLSMQRSAAKQGATASK